MVAPIVAKLGLDALGPLIKAVIYVLTTLTIAAGIMIYDIPVVEYVPI